MKTWSKTALCVGLMASVSACGTVNTVIRGDEVAALKLKRERTYCRSIPRMYSGVAYNVCRLFGEPRSDTAWWPDTEARVDSVIWDATWSSMLDTLFLPYTAYRQCVDGNIVVE